MEKIDRPKIKVQMKYVDWIIEIIGLMIIIILIIIPLMSYKILVFDNIAHFDKLYNLDKSFNLFDLIIYSAIGLIIYIVLSIQNRYILKYPFPIIVTEDNAERLYKISSRRLRILKVIILLFILFHVIQKILIAQKIIQRSNSIIFLVFILIFIAIYYVSNYQMKKVK